MAAYEAALAGQPLQVGSARTLPGTVRALAISYYGSAQFRAMAATTQQDYRNVIERFCKDHGDKRAAALQRDHVVRLLAGRKPNNANRLRKILRAMMTHAVEMGMRADDPTRDVKAMKIKTDGYPPWTELDIAQYEARHPVGSRARLALALLVYTGQRRGDVIHLGRQHVRDGFIHVRQKKTGAELAIPVHSNLAELIAGTTDRLTFLQNDLGRPFTLNSFSNWFRAQCDMANLHHLSAHGLRKTAAGRLAEAGCTANEIAAITGHASLREVARYTKAADQKRLAHAAMKKAEARTFTVNPGGMCDKKEDIS
jgi:integrase